MKKIVLTYGLIAGAVLAAMMWLTLPFMDRIGFDKGMVVGYTTMVLAFLMVYFGVRSYRDQVAGGGIGFWRAFGVGLAIVGVATVCYVLSWQLLYHLVIPDFPDRYAAYAIEKARSSGASAAQIEATAREMAAFKTLYADPLVRIGFSVLEPLPVGLLASGVSAALLSRRRRAA
jgi:Protein of unknown function (DUF4199)